MNSCPPTDTGFVTEPRVPARHPDDETVLEAFDHADGRWKRIDALEPGVHYWLRTRRRVTLA